MKPKIIDIHINNKSGKYSDNIGFYALGISRALGFAGPGDLITKAFGQYEQNLSGFCMEMMKCRAVCSYFHRINGIHYKQDILYFLRRPDRIADDEIYRFPELNRKMVQFNNVSTDPDVAAVVDYLESFTPANRADEVSKMLEQYFVKTSNPFYMEQAFLRFYYYLMQFAAFDEDGMLDKNSPGFEKANELIDMLWNMGRS